MEIAPNVHWIDAGFVNMYLFADEDGWTLVDTGRPRDPHLVFATLEKLGQKPKDLKRILITHADYDHTGGLAAIQKKSEATVFASLATKPYLLSGKSPNHLPALMQTIVNTFFKFDPIPEDVIQPISDGDVLAYLGGIQVMQTRGHTLDHHAFYNPATGVLFAGDALNTKNGRINSSPKRMTAKQDLATLSAIKLLELAPATLACGHGTPLSNYSTKEVMTLFNELRQE